MEETAAGRQKGFKVSVRRVLPGTGSGVHQEMVSVKHTDCKEEGVETCFTSVTVRVCLKHHRHSG